MSSMWTNRRVAQTLFHIADLLDIQGENRFKVMAYRRAAENILNLGREVTDVWAEGRLQTIPGVGKAIAEKLDELFRTDRMTFLEELEAEVPPTLPTLLEVPDVGPRTVQLVWQHLGITTLQGLRRAARAGKLRQLPGLGEKTEARILAGLEALEQRTGRHLLGSMWPLAQSLLDALRDAVPAITQAEMAGSVRRRRATVGDLDLLVSAPDPCAVMDAFIALPAVTDVLLSGPTKTSVVLHEAVQADLRVLPQEQWGAALQYFTGSKAHNIRLRELAQAQGLSLSEYGFKEGETLTPCATEEEVYGRLGLPWIPPELREDRGEIEAAQEGRLPDLVEMADLRGDLHAHTDWSDGRSTLEEMAEAARALGLEYLLVSDHSQGLGIAGGLSPSKWRRQHQQIQGLNTRWDDFHLLHGAEVEIRADGSLDYPDEFLAQMDVVVASVHTSLRQPREQMTERVLLAMGSPHVDIIGHPMGRILEQRVESAVDVDRVLAAAAETGVALEVNSAPERLDLADIYIRRAVELGVRLAITSDAHSTEGLHALRYGVATARRGWATRADIVNCLPLEGVRAFVRERGRAGS